ncbi:MAG: hypothetical protein M0Z95_16710 [Actinomycetota bacterium]|nr:hypothetical protein [Actinomycetota bacterium]
MGTDAVEWIPLDQPAGAAIYAGHIVAALSVFILAIAARSASRSGAASSSPLRVRLFPRPNLSAGSS